MAKTDQPRRDVRVSGAGSTSAAPSITPLFPLLLLETMRDMDRPTEVLADEDVTVSLPRRLGLSDVVGVQIRRFQEEVRQKRLQAAAPVLDLMRLVIRRPDAEEIFHDAGRRIARHHWEQRAPTMRRLVTMMPQPLARIAAHRAAQRMFERLTVGNTLHVSRWPMELRIRDSLSAQADPGGAACAFYSGAYAEHLQFYTHRQYRVRHPECITRGGSVCQWTVEVAS